jgi:hypothetical protein
LFIISQRPYNCTSLRKLYVGTIYSIAQCYKILAFKLQRPQTDFRTLPRQMPIVKQHFGIHSHTRWTKPLEYLVASILLVHAWKGEKKGREHWEGKKEKPKRAIFSTCYTPAASSAFDPPCCTSVLYYDRGCLASLANEVTDKLLQQWNSETA